MRVPGCRLCEGCRFQTQSPVVLRLHMRAPGVGSFSLRGHMGKRPPPLSHLSHLNPRTGSARHVHGPRLGLLSQIAI